MAHPSLSPILARFARCSPALLAAALAASVALAEGRARPAAAATGEPAAATGQPAAAAGEPAAVTGEPAAATGDPAAYDSGRSDWRLTPGIASFSFGAGGTYVGTEHAFGAQLGGPHIVAGYVLAAFELQGRHVLQGGGLRYVLEGAEPSGAVRGQLGLGLGFHYLGDPCRTTSCGRCDLRPWWGLLRFTPRVLLGGRAGSGWLFFVFGGQVTALPELAAGLDVGLEAAF